MYDIREWVGRQPNQTRRMRSRLIGRNGRIRSLIEEISRCEMAIYGSTVLVIGDEDGLALAAPAIEGILRGSEHSTVLHGLEQDRKRQRIRSRRLESYEERSPDETSTFETLVPGLAEARRRRERILCLLRSCSRPCRTVLCSEPRKIPSMAGAARASPSSSPMTSTVEPYIAISQREISSIRLRIRPFLPISLLLILRV
jgi:hypothetical protein